MTVSHPILFVYKTHKETQDASIGGGLLALYDYGARYYDPVLGRWFSVDPKTQLANPYQFCGNSPGMYVDPDGQFFGIAIAIAYLAALTTSVIQQNLNPEANFFRNVGLNFLAGVATAGVGEIFGATGNLLTEIFRGLTHGAVQGGIGTLQGNDFLSGFASATLSSWASTGFGTTRFGKTTFGKYAYGGLAGGIGSAAAGGKFLDGMASGLAVAGLNHALHSVSTPQETSNLTQNAYKEGQNWEEGMPLAVEVNGEVLVVSTETGKYVNINNAGLNNRYVQQLKNQGKAYKASPVGTVILSGDMAAFLNTGISLTANLIPTITPNQFQEIEISSQAAKARVTQRNIMTKMHHYRKEGIIK